MEEKTLLIFVVDVQFLHFFVMHFCHLVDATQIILMPEWTSCMTCPHLKKKHEQHYKR